MSGRVRVTLADGRRVTGYRKTLARVESRRQPHEMPDWRLSFVAPAHLFLVPGMDTGIVGVTILPPNTMIEGRGKNRKWVFEQVCDFLDSIHAIPFECMGTLAREEGVETKSSRELAYQPGEILWGGRAPT